MSVIKPIKGIDQSIKNIDMAAHHQFDLFDMCKHLQLAWILRLQLSHQI